MSDKALVHALYISKLSDAEINMMNVIEPDFIPPSALLSFIRSDSSLERTKQKLGEIFENAAREMLERKVQFCRSLLKEDNKMPISYSIRAEKPAHEIIRTSEEGNGYDLIVMASSKIISPVRVLGSTTRQVIDSVRKPVLIVHE